MVAQSLTGLDQERDQNWLKLAPHACLVSNLQGQVLRVDAALGTLLQRPVDQMTGQPLWQFVAAADHGVLANLLSQAARAYGGVIDGQLRIVPVDQRPIQCHVVTTPAAGSGEQKLLHWCFRDIMGAVGRLSAELQRKNDELAVLAIRLTHAERRERERLAQVLHDDLQQSLLAVRLRLDLLLASAAGAPLSKDLREIGDIINEAIRSTRIMTVQLSPPVLRERGLPEALRWLAQLFESRFGLSVTIETDERGPESIEMRDLLFQMVRELLFNVVKHAGVDHAHVRLSDVGDEACEVVVSDSGRGFDPDKVWVAGKDSIGLGSVGHRLQLLGGRMELNSSPGYGTQVKIRVPTAPPPVSKFLRTIQGQKLGVQRAFRSAVEAASADTVNGKIGPPRPAAFRT